MTERQKLSVSTPGVIFRLHVKKKSSGTGSKSKFLKNPENPAMSNNVQIPAVGQLFNIAAT